MSSSWIDREELDKLVGACSKRKPGKKRRNRREKPDSAEDEVSPQAVSEEAPEAVPSVFEVTPETKEVAEAEFEVEFEVESEENVRKEPDIEDEPEPESEGEPELEEEPGATVTRDGDVFLESIPGLLISSPLLAHGEGIDLDQIETENDLPTAEPEDSGDDREEAVGPPPVIETIKNLVIEEPAGEGRNDSDTRFLGESVEVIPDEEPALLETEARRAIQSLAEAREQVDSSQLLKLARESTGDSEGDHLETFFIDDSEAEAQGGKEEETDDFFASFPRDLPVSLHERLKILIRHLEAHFSAGNSIVFDQDGFPLFLSEESGEGIEKWNLSALRSWPGINESDRTAYATQVKPGVDESWMCHVRGASPAAHLSVCFERAEPAEGKGLLDLSRMLAETVYSFKTNE
ncbi:MAG: hypothetical protein P1U68_17675 [Verrucomicrobiales bacterium]|nr:hypothetical protein [Verrucomicrobiales bacterium]